MVSHGVWEHFFGWRCIACGEIVDQMILEKGDDFGESMTVSRRNYYLSACFEKMVDKAVIKRYSQKRTILLKAPAEKFS